MTPGLRSLPVTEGVPLRFARASGRAGFMTTHNKPSATVTIAGKTVPRLQAALMFQEAYRLGVQLGEVGAVELPESAPRSIEIGGKRISVAAGAALAVASDSQGVPPRKLLDSVVETYLKKMLLQEEAKALQSAARAFDSAREAVAPAAIAWFRGHGYDGPKVPPQKVPPVDRRLARVVQDYTEARQHLERCLHPESSRRRRASRTR